MTGKKLAFDVEHSNMIIFLSPDGKQRYIADAAADSRGNLLPKALIQFMTSQGRRNLYHPEPGGSWTVPQAMQILSWLVGRPIPGGQLVIAAMADGEDMLLPFGRGTVTTSGSSRRW